ncbi:unnamed protein product [Rotaria sp. Silwood2]|nr:unnamed protein product [Rotaria sp. Silwood2]
MTSSEFYNNLIISSLFPFQIDKQPSRSKTLRHSYLDGLALLLNDSNQSTSVYPLEYSQSCLTSNEHDMGKIYSLLISIIFEYNKNKCIKRITDDLFDDAVSNLEKLPNVNVDNLCQKITYNKLKKGSTDYYYLKEKNILLKEYILILFDWIKFITLNQDAIKNNKNNVELKIILKFQVTGEFLYNSEIFRFILSEVYSNSNDTERIIYYLDKVSAHRRSLNLILKTLEKRKSEYGQKYKNIQWSFIEPIKTIVELKETPSSSFDKILLACDLANDEIKREFQDKFIENKFVEYDSSFKLLTC